jgi:hypothetical protein
VCAECKEDLGVQACIHVSDDRRVRCLSCAGLDHLEFLARGSAALTRRATRESKLSAIVLKWSKRYKRYERRGTLVERAALMRAEYACLLDREARARGRQRARELREALDESFVLAFASRIRAAFPNCPPKRERAIAEHACAKGTWRVGRTAMAKAFDGEAILLAVRAHVRHHETRYDALLASGMHVWQARIAVQRQIDAVLAEWRG